ncbi:MAG: hypothetical protein M1153_01715 [Patescibacteria group bacterium]|nr:hypothetical protein [Patescibacteria group bacterium]
MNLSYFRKSKYNLEETSSRAKKLAEDIGWKVMGEQILAGEKSRLIFISRPEWAAEALRVSNSAIALLPSAMLVREEDRDRVVIGIGNPAIMGDAFGNPELTKETLVMEAEVRNLIDGAAGVEAIKPTKTVVYSTTTCPYCKMEKAYLDEKGVKYENILVDINQEAAKEMVRRTGQMGVPVTQVEYDDAEPEYVIGFDKERLNKLLHIA